MTDEDVTAIVDGIAPVVRDFVKTAVADLTARLTVADLRYADVVAVAKDVGTIRERLAVLETRAPVPGPAGPAGTNGVDGIGFDDLTIEQADDTTVTVKAVRGDVVKVLGSVTFPVMTFEGDFEAGREYLPGQLVRVKSALWHCRRATTLAPDALSLDGQGKPAGPQGKDFWTLLLRDGRRGSDGKNGDPGPAGKPGRDWQQVYDDTRRV